MRRRVAGLAMMILLLVFSVSFGGLGEVDTSLRLTPPSGTMPFGTDTLGRSLLERVAAGTGTSLFIGGIVAIASFALGILLALCCFIPGFPRRVAFIFADAVKAVPSIVLALFSASLSGPGILSLAVSLSLAHIADIFRTSYSHASAIMKEPYIDAARCAGVGRVRIFITHVLPPLLPYAAMQSVSSFLSAVIGEATLSFLGCGVPIPIPSLGSILSEARSVILSSPWMMFFPASFLLLLGIALNLIAFSLSDPDPASERT